MKICRISFSRRSHRILNLSSPWTARTPLQQPLTTYSRPFTSLREPKHFISDIQQTSCRASLWNAPLTVSRLRGISTMAKPAGIDQLTSLVNGLTLDSVIEKYPQAHPEINPLDLYRAHLSNVLAGISAVDTQLIYPAINWTTGLDKGDFVLAVPALRIKGEKPDALATKWAAEVDCLPRYCNFYG